MVWIDFFLEIFLRSFARFTFMRRRSTWWPYPDLCAELLCAGCGVRKGRDALAWVSAGQIELWLIKLICSELLFFVFFPTRSKPSSFISQSWSAKRPLNDLFSLSGGLGGPWKSSKVGSLFGAVLKKSKKHQAILLLFQKLVYSTMVLLHFGFFTFFDFFTFFEGRSWTRGKSNEIWWLFYINTFYF